MNKDEKKILLFLFSLIFSQDGCHLPGEMCVLMMVSEMCIFIFLFLPKSMFIDFHALRTWMHAWGQDTGCTLGTEMLDVAEGGDAHQGSGCTLRDGAIGEHFE